MRSRRIAELLQPTVCDADLVLAEQLRELRIDDDGFHGEVHASAFPKSSEAIRHGGRAQQFASGLDGAELREHTAVIAGVVSGFRSRLSVGIQHPLCEMLLNTGV